ncbi:hypothetical protein [Phormidesmis priestleyi]|uniref:hypothetical protein n=1 Tax=Phormidesmis priestleyi TaxID=268141 RepID=UPI00083A153F|nr:hypothetical protein [Phormidesmis priestleyi]
MDLLTIVKMRGEASIELVLNQDDEEVEPLRGRIDILTMQNRALLNADMKCPPHEVGQALANPSP